MTRLARSAFVTAALLSLTLSTQVFAQSAVPPRKGQISANPFGLLFDLFNAEYERKVSPSATAGVGGSTLTSRDVDYLNVDAFYRFYPRGVPLEGFAFGVKAGLTKKSSSDDMVFGVGVDLNRS